MNDKYNEIGVITITTEQIIIKAMEELELTPTQYMKIQQSYNALATELQKNGENVDVYLQGSIRLGTTIKPYKGNKNADFDVDIVAEYSANKDNETPQNVRDYVGDVLKSNGTYSQKLSEKKRCWRIDYAEQNGLGYHADVLPSIPEDTNIISTLKARNGYEHLTASSIAITHKDNKQSEAKWSMSNPKGYANWFESINQNRYASLIEQRKRILVAENSNLFLNTEQVPNALAKTPMQRVIQVLKRHRDVYFSGLKREDDKPISIIITTLVTEIVSTLNLQHLSFVELLSEVTKALVEANGLIENRYFSSYRINAVLYKDDEGWKLLNPVNTGENFADAWNKNPNKSVAFFGWLKAIKRDIVDNYYQADFHEIFCRKLEVANPERFADRKPVISVGAQNGSKPWSKYDK